MPFSFTQNRGFWLLLLYYVGLLPFMPIQERFLISFLPTIINRCSEGSHLSSLSSPGPQLLCLQKPLLLKPIVQGPQLPDHPQA